MGERRSRGASELESQLRAMILGNVVIRDDNQDGSPRGGQRGHRGRGRRGRPNDSQQHFSQHEENPRVGNAFQRSHHRGQWFPDRGGRHRGGFHAHRGSEQGDSTATTDLDTTTDQQFQRRNRHPHEMQDHSSLATDHGLPQNYAQFHRGGPRRRAGPRSLFEPYGKHHLPQPPTFEMFTAQSQYLDRLVSSELPFIMMTNAEYNRREQFRARIESICQAALRANDSHKGLLIGLRGFGSVASGLASTGSDVDLAIVLRMEHNFEQVEDVGRGLPRLLEQALLEEGYGARLLTRTRVPILKLCETPSKELYDALCDEREKWEALPEKEKFAVEAEAEENSKESKDPDAQEARPVSEEEGGNKAEMMNGKKLVRKNTAASEKSKNEDDNADVPQTFIKPDDNDRQHELARNDRANQPQGRTWRREKAMGPLDFPKTGVGIQCDINFSNELALHNTVLLRCYSLCDPRVVPMVLFIKNWAKQRKINSAYSGTLSSYGYVLMVLHYLVNIAQPPVLPNLQLLVTAPSLDPRFININLSEQEPFPTSCAGADIRFWRSENEIRVAAANGLITQNRDSLGVLLRNFFQHFAVPGPPTQPHPPYHHHHHQQQQQPPVPGFSSPPPPPPPPPPLTHTHSGFHWTQDVLSLRTPGGVLSKQAKGWTGARTTRAGVREVRHRYLLAVEDPFEIEHNVARTVTHHGIVAIRDEFRRAWRILGEVARGEPHEGLLDDVEVAGAIGGVEMRAEGTNGREGKVGGKAEGVVDAQAVPTGA